VDQRAAVSGVLSARRRLAATDKTKENRMSTTIRPDAQIAVTQKCMACRGQGLTGEVSSSCRKCGHHYTEADLEAERNADNAALNAGTPMPDTQHCGCSWSYRLDEDEHCAECDGTGTQHLTITIRELSAALASLGE
jgi:DnaJ-class molecular chaperone